MNVNKVPEIVNIVKLCIIYCWQYKNLIFDFAHCIFYYIKNNLFQNIKKNVLIFLHIHLQHQENKITN